MPNKLTAAEFREIGERVKAHEFETIRESPYGYDGDIARLHAAIERLIVESSDGTIFAIRTPGRLFYKSTDAAIDALLGVSNEHET